jgi:transcriptional regulator with XRE-family HTH domain
MEQDNLAVLIGERITTLRKAAGLSQDGISQKLNVTRSAIAQWETGRAYPSFAHIQELARLFGVSVSYVLSGEIVADLAPNETRMLQHFRNLAGHDQRLLLNMAQRLQGLVAPN